MINIILIELKKEGIEKTAFWKFKLYNKDKFNKLILQYRINKNLGIKKFKIQLKNRIK